MKRIFHSIQKSIADEKPLHETYEIYNKSMESITITMNANVLTDDELHSDDVNIAKNLIRLDPTKDSRSQSQNDR